MKNNYIIITIIVAFILRLTLGLYNPPNNSYDDHLEPVSYSINNITFNHEDCWECYQPPLYYNIVSIIFKVSYSISKDYFLSWKSVQIFNILLSLFNILIIFSIIKSRISNQLLIAVSLSFIAILPRDLYASAMITNDYLLVFLTSLSIMFFLRYLDYNKLKDLILLSISIIAATFSKQHGLILLSIPSFLLVKVLINENNIFDNIKKCWKRIVLLILVPIIGISGLLRSFFKTGVFMVSNQDFFNYTDGQLPGDISKIDFFSIRLIELFKNPFISNLTLDSYWTELFARFWSDYEWRYFDIYSPFSSVLSSLLLIYGIVITLFFIIGFFRKKWNSTFTNFVLLFVLFSFLFVPLVQTIRYPYFSSMKSQFFLPAISIIVLVFAKLIETFNLSNIKLKLIIISSLTLGIIHIVFIVSNLDLALPNLSGPLWQFPYVNIQ